MTPAYLPDPAFDAWEAKAKSISPLQAATRLGFTPKGGAAARSRGVGEIVGPCPRCGGVDRFSVKPSENAWYCRGADKGGYDAIGLVRYVRDCGFVEALEWLTGEPRPGRVMPIETPEAAAARDAEIAQLQAEAERQRQMQAQDTASYRENERRRCHALWCAAQPAAGTLVEAYFRWRGIPEVPPGAKIRFHPDLRLYHPPGMGGAVVYSGPAMVAAGVDNDGRFSSLHQTWLDPRLADGSLPPGSKGRLVLVPPGESEPTPAKRARGSARGSHLVVAPCADPRELVVGEGIETVLSVWATLREHGADLSRTVFWTSFDLGNLGGPTAETVRHPTLKAVDKRGRERARRVPGPLPKMTADVRAIALPDSIEQVLILADGDSDRFTVECAAARARARWERPGRSIRIAWPDEGSDFNTMRMKLLGRTQ